MVVTLNVFQYSEVAQSCPTLCDPMDYSLPGSSVHGIFQARRVLEWGAIAFSEIGANILNSSVNMCIILEAKKVKSLFFR